MGFEIKRFQGDVDEELICPICSGVLEDPLQAPACEHAFCRACITEWISRQPTCPVDRQAVTSSQLRPVPRILRNLLSRMSSLHVAPVWCHTHSAVSPNTTVERLIAPPWCANIAPRPIFHWDAMANQKMYVWLRNQTDTRLCTFCDNAPHGCNATLKLDSLASHLVECEFNPKRPMPCEAGCGLVIPKDELAAHNCVRDLRSLVAAQQCKLAEYQQELAEQRLIINEHKRELALLKEFMRAMRLSNPTMRALADQMEREEVIRWANSLPRARVTRWGGMISTPDEVLQLMIKRCLSESACPPHIIDDLMENCHERRWPPGLSSLETRQNNRRLYEKYVCRRVPGKQAVLVLQCDNAHVDEHMMVEPGLVMIFAHGIE